MGKPLHIEKYRSIIGIFLLATIFIIPIVYSSVSRNASAESSVKQEQADDYNLGRLFYKQKIDRIDSFMQAHQQRVNFQGNVLVGYKGHLIYQGSFGYANPLKQKPMDKDAVFQLASVSKQFTAMGALIAIEKGLLNYTDTVTRFFPDFPYPNITVQMLLNHTAGLPNYMWLLEHHWNKETPPYNDQVIDLMAQHQLSLHFTPGTRFGYSNTGYVVLAAVIEQATGRRFDHFLEQEIFDPLGMEHTFVHSPAYPSSKKHLHGYKYWGRGYYQIPMTVNDGAVGDKGVYSTIRDLYKWDQALYQNQLVEASTIKKAYQPVQLKNGNHYPYGFGFRIKENNGKKVVYHYGKWNGFRTGIIRYIEDTSTIIILNHTNRPYNSQITEHIKDYLETKS